MQAYLFDGHFAPGMVSGIARVEVGVSGPITDSTRPLTATVPAFWQTATLSDTGAAITPWQVTLSVAANGNYRLYARATDRAGNHREVWHGYLGNIWVNDATTPFGQASLSLDTPVLSQQTHLSLRGIFTSTQPAQSLRVFDGYGWHSLPPATGLWSLDTLIPPSDRRTLALRVLARDAYGAVLYATRSLTVDTFIAPPVLSANLVAGQWQTDISPTLVISWPTPTDASGVVGTWAVIDTISNTIPTTPSLTNRVTRTLNQAGVYYGHVRVRDGAGNEFTSHAGPFPLNRTRTPSSILPDGLLDLSHGEYPPGTLLNYDPYARFKPAALYGTWNDNTLFLGYRGHGWGTTSHLAVYLDTLPGGLTRTLPISNVHPLPFAADFALLVGGTKAGTSTLYSAGTGTWLPVVSPHSRAVVGPDTEIILDRSEIQAQGAVSLLALAEDANGVWAVFPAGVGHAMTGTLTGTLALGAALRWATLGRGMIPAEGQKQVIAPVVTIPLPWDNVVTSTRVVTFPVVIRNPDLAPYTAVSVTVQTAPELGLQSVQGATCNTCPTGGNHWNLLTDVAAGGVHTITLVALTGGQTVEGAASLPITVTLADSGLLANPQPPARGRYRLNHGTANLSVLTRHNEVYVQPGDVQIAFLPHLDTSTLLRCANQVEVNPGSGWQVICPLGDCTLLPGRLATGTSQTWQIRTRGANGRLSTPVTRTLVADSIAPSAQIVTGGVLTGTLAFVRGIAWEDFPTTYPPAKVEVSINGGRFRPALLSSGQTLLRANLTHPAAATIGWLFPLHLTTQDGETAQLVARAVDEAGNVGPNTITTTVTLDNQGPVITVTQFSTVLTGTVSDGSGVASVEVSLDGGVSYQSALLRGENWSFGGGTGTGWPSPPFAILRATDIWGNVTRQLAFPPLGNLYLPLVLR